MYAFDRIKNRFATATLTLAFSFTSLETTRAASTGTAADIVPADCAFFSTSTQLRRQYDAIVKSKAFGRIKNLEYLQMGWQQLKALPQYQHVMDVLETPLAKEALAVLQDGFSQEFFVYGGRGWAELFGVLFEFQQQNLIGTIRAAVTKQQPNALPALVSTVLAHRDLRMPPIVFGCKIADKARAEKLLDQIQQAIEGVPTPVKPERKPINGGSLLATVLSAKLIPMNRDDVVQGLARANVAADDAGRLFDWMQEQTLAVSLGIKGDYFILSVGADNAHLLSLGAGAVLSDSPSLQPIAKHLGNRNLVGIGYASLAIQSLNELDAKAGAQSLGQMLDPVAAFLPPELVARLRKDIPEVLGDIAAAAPKPSEMVEVAILNNGIERFAYSKSPTPGIDYSKPLTILRHAGAAPMLAFAWQSASSAKEYDRAVHWAKRFFGYWTDFGLPLLRDEQRQQYQRFADIVLPALDAIERTTRAKLLPSVDAGQGLIVLDTDLRIQPIAGLPVAFVKPMPMFELAIVCTLNDRKLFVEAMSEYLATLDGVIPKIAALSGGQLPEPFRIPRPSETPFGNEASMYAYGFISGFTSLVGPDLSPHAIVSDDLLILSLSPKMSQRLLKPSSDALAGAVDFGAPSGSAAIVRPAGLWSAVREWLEYAERVPGSPLGPQGPGGGKAVREHLDVVLDALGTYRGTTSRSFRDGDYVVRHSLSRFEDVP